MAHTNTISLYLPDASATDALGAALAPMLEAGQLVSLEGELGAGKSALARALIRALTGQADLEVPSPSFALVQPYQGPDFDILHADLYRLSHPDEAEELGLFEREGMLVLVEWAARAPALLAEADLRIALDRGPKGEGRVVQINAPGGGLPMGLAAALGGQFAAAR